jgi:hypothetical protein
MLKLQVAGFGLLCCVVPDGMSIAQSLNRTGPNAPAGASPKSSHSATDFLRGAQIARQRMGTSDSEKG